MIFLRSRYLLFIFIILSTVCASAQDKPIGYWESLLPYNTAVGLASNGVNTLYPICAQTFFSYNTTSGSKETFAKEDGMSDIGMQCVSYDITTGTLVLVYTDGNIDLFKNNSFYNIADLKVTTVAGNKSVYQVYTENGMAYVCTSLGILVIDLTQKVITENIQFISNSQQLGVNSFVGAGNYFYAATAKGLYQASKSDPQLQNFADWALVDSTDSLVCVAAIDTQLFMATQKKVFALVGDTAKLVYLCAQVAPDTTYDTIITHLDAGNGKLLISEMHLNNFNGDVKIMDTNFNIVGTLTNLGYPLQAVQLSDTTVWVADGYYGLMKEINTSNFTAQNPPGPSDYNSWDIYANNGDLWIAHGGFSDLFLNNNNFHGVSNLKNGKWMYYTRYLYPPFDTLVDFVALTKDENNGTLYFCSYQDGLFILNADGTYQLVGSSVFDGSYHYPTYANNREITGVAIDQSDNVWVTAATTGAQLYVKAASTGAWYKYIVPGASVGGSLVIDGNGQVWFIGDQDNSGVSIFSVDNTFSNPSTYHMGTGVGTGNLPSNNVLSIAKDLNDQIWIGTDNGIGIASGCVAPFSNTPPCDAEIPIVQYDQFAGYLFSGSNVRSIAVDGANRKWIGTDNGVWLLSPDASKIIYNFTAENSPLPADGIQKITIDNVTGNVYIGTTAGLICYRSTATSGGTSNQNVEVFPNPVVSGYTGTIAIKGLVDNADVRITDIDGELVYRTTALGGQAVWGGTDYTGHRPQSGVYLIFVTSADGSQTYVGKVVFLK